ncbi:MAG: TolC family protein, partial [Mariprofundales bacterium]|nr:TolC family protein [Mariprofundales bacterium]
RSLLDQAQAEQIEGLLDGSFGVTAAASDTRTHTVSPFAAVGTTNIQLGYQMRQPLANGDSITASMLMVRSMQKYPATTPLAFRSLLNPLYQSQIDLIWRTPLLKGRGNPDYHQQRSAARYATEADSWQIEVVRYQLAGEVLAAFFQHRINRIRVQLAKDARHRAQQLLYYQRKQERFGLIEPADRLQSEALLAQRVTDLVQAQAALSASAIQLQRLLAADRVPQQLEVSSHTTESLPTLSQLEQIADDNRPEYRLLAARLAAADAELERAEAADATQLDLVGQVGTRGQEGLFKRAFRSGLSVSHRFAQLSLELSDSVGSHSEQAAIQRAEVAREQVVVQQAQTARKIGDSLALIRSSVETGRRLLHAYTRQVEAEREKFRAEMLRYRAGRSDTATIIQFEGDLRRVTLQQALQEESLKLASYQLRLARGDWSVMQSKQNH